MEPYAQSRTNGTNGPSETSGTICKTTYKIKKLFKYLHLQDSNKIKEKKKKKKVL